MIEQTIGFTEGHGTWWPLATHHIGTKPAATAVIEPGAGGRWFERAADGEECDLGTRPGARRLRFDRRMDRDT